MKNEMNVNDLINVTEVQLIYKTRIKASDRPKISDMDDAVRIFRQYWSRDRIEHVEEVKILLLNRSNKVLGIATISLGGISGSVIDERIILQYAIKSNASAVILAHNHPSGNVEPSEADNRITTKLRNSLEMIGISLLDHIIITSDGHNSII
jgi:DNA repair protein RadC